MQSMNGHLHTRILLQLHGICRVAMWIEHSFGTENGVQQGPEGVDAHFMSLRDGMPLTLSMRGSKVSNPGLYLLTSTLSTLSLSLSERTAQIPRRSFWNNCTSRH